MKMFKDVNSGKDVLTSRMVRQLMRIRVNKAMKEVLLLIRLNPSLPLALDINGLNTDKNEEVCSVQDN